MITRVAASVVQKNFGLWHDKALKEPVLITKYGRETACLISAEMFRALWTSAQQRGDPTRQLAQGEAASPQKTRTAADHDPAGK